MDQLWHTFCMLSSAVLHPGSLAPNTRLQATSFAKKWIIKEAFSLQNKPTALCMLSALSSNVCMTVHKWKLWFMFPRSCGCSVLGGVSLNYAVLSAKALELLCLFFLCCQVQIASRQSPPRAAAVRTFKCDIQELQLCYCTLAIEHCS